jgi:hypothetical protein
VGGLAIEDAVAKVSIPEKYPLSYGREPRIQIERQAAAGAGVRNSLRGFSKGTALAVMLSERGLGFRPVRSESGEISLEVVLPGEEENSVWPIGWEPKLTPPKTAPLLFKLVSIDLNDVGFIDVLTAISVRGEIDVLFNYNRIAAKQIDLGMLPVSFPARQAAYNTLLRSITLSNRLKHEIRVDEAARPFVWITTVELRAAER